jgi:LuxR family maltose regulon positive regulatory protein
MDYGALTYCYNPAMPSPLLETKFFVPSPRPEYVVRPRLLDKLQAGLNHKLTIVSAPAGYGKTTLISNWIHENDLKVGWLSLDERDNSSEIFLRYLVHALRKVTPDVGDSALDALQDSPKAYIDESVITFLLNELALSVDSLALVLDDYHFIHSQFVDQALNFIVDHQPPALHLFIATRIDPPLPLARWRASGELNEIRTDDLRFTIEEATQFLNESSGLSLLQDNIAALESRTEGWIAGLHMAALSLRSRVDPARFVTEFSRSHRFVMDYLLQEVLYSQSEEIQDFLLHTAILERLNGPLCDYLTGRDNSLSILEQLDRSNLFIVPLDNERVWYRYHDMFAQLLQKQLSNTATAVLPELHRKASRWYAQEGLLSEAVWHALAGKDVDGLEKLIQDNSLAMIFHGELKTVLNWLKALPDEMVRSQPWLSVVYAWVLVYTGELEAAEIWIQNAEKELAPSTNIGEYGGDKTRRLIQSGILGQVETIRAYLALLQGQIQKAELYGRQALEHLRQEDLLERSFTAIHLASALVWSGNLTEAAQVAAKGVEQSRRVGESHITADALGVLAGILVHQGKLRDAHFLCLEALRLTEEYHSRSGHQLPAIGLVYSRLSTIHLQWNEIDRAVSYAQEAIQNSEQWQQADVIFVAYWSLISAILAQGDLVSLNSVIKKAKRLAGAIVPYHGFTDSIEAEACLLKGDLEGALQWTLSCGLSSDDEFHYGEIGPYLTLARVLIAQYREIPANQERIEKLLDKLLYITEEAGGTLVLIRVLNLKAVFFYLIGENDQALLTLERSLALGEPDRILRNFIDVRESLQQLLRVEAVQKKDPGYVREIMAAIAKETGAREDGGVPIQSGLQDPLSERELQVLRLLNTSQSRPEIAQHLFISINTVRTHLKSIYSKLGVKSRLEAVQRGQELGLLD